MEAMLFCFVAFFALALAAPQIGKESPSNHIDFRIFGGNETTIEKYPYQLSLRINGRHDCGASVLTTTRALTAAHCIAEDSPPSQYSIKAGSTHHKDQIDLEEQIRNVSRYIVHSKYHRPTTRYDIALLYWMTPLIYGKNVHPIVLPQSTYVMPYGRLAITSGWGQMRVNGHNVNPPRLRAIATPLVNNTVCNLAYRGRVKAEMVCTESVGGRTVCSGDSGGPLVDRSGNTFLQIGVVSWGGACGSPDAPSVYARVSHFTAWIRANI